MHLVGIELHTVLLLFFIAAINQYGRPFAMKTNESRRFLFFVLTLSLLLTPVYDTEPSNQITIPLPFVDIDQHWAMDAIHRAFKKNIILGYGDGTFRPDHPVSHSEFTTMLTRSGAILGNALSNTLIPDTTLRDSIVDKDQILDWARDGMIKLLQMGYLKGHEDGRLDPGGLLTRAEAVTLLDRLALRVIQDEANQIPVDKDQHRHTNPTYSQPTALSSQEENPSVQEITTSGAFILNYNHLYQVTMVGDGTVTNFSSASTIDSSIQPTAPTPPSFLVISFQIPLAGSRKTASLSRSLMTNLLQSLPIPRTSRSV